MSDLLLLSNKSQNIASIERCVMSCYRGSKISGSIIFLDRDGWPFVLSNDGRKIPATLSFLKAIMHRKKNFVVFFPHHIGRTTVC